MGALCCCFGSSHNHRNALPSSGSGPGPQCPTKINNTLVTSSNSTNENIKDGRHDEQKSEPNQERFVVLSPKSTAENIQEIASSSHNEEQEKSEDRLRHVFSSWEDEDVCPTCYEDYTPENPKIIAHCSHHYHLGCIYDWMERSKDCPICAKLMEFEGMQ